MIHATECPLWLKMPVGLDFVPLSAAFTSHAVRGLGLDIESAEELALAVEEVCAYLSHIGTESRPVTIECAAGSHFIETRISLPVRNLQLHAFNMTARLNTDDESGLDQMGLLIASRMTDRFRINRPTEGNLALTLVKERRYPKLSEELIEPPSALPLAGFTIHAPDAARIKWFVRRVNQTYPAALVPEEFRYPGKVVDMAAGKDFRLLTADGPGGEMGGGIAWRQIGSKTVEMLGPYIFQPDHAGSMACDLVETCIAKVARTQAMALINRRPPPELPEGYLEVLDAVQNTGSTSAIPGPARFRLLLEDSGTVVWAHPDVVPFLKNEYRRLVFPRDIQPVDADGEAGEPFSVLSAEMDRCLGQVTLRPIWPGADSAANLAQHLELLRAEGMRTYLFEMDLGQAWQADFTPGLLSLGFTPRLILPHAGTADLLLFERPTDDRS